VISTLSARVGMPCDPYHFFVALLRVRAPLMFALPAATKTIFSPMF